MGAQASRIPTWAMLLLFLIVGLMVYGVGYWVYRARTARVPEDAVLEVTNRDFATFAAHNPEFAHIFPPDEADETATLSPQALHRYHAWNRWANPYLPNRPVPNVELVEFLAAHPYWEAPAWGERPSPALRQHFYGWKNNRLESQELDAYQPTYRELNQLLDQHPQFGPHYWRRPLQEDYPRYLEDHSAGNAPPNQPIPHDQMAPFLKQALFNRRKALNNS